MHERLVVGRLWQAQPAMRTRPANVIVTIANELMHEGEWVSEHGGTP